MEPNEKGREYHRLLKMQVSKCMISRVYSKCQQPLCIVSLPGPKLEFNFCLLAICYLVNYFTFM